MCVKSEVYNVSVLLYLKSYKGIIDLKPLRFAYLSADNPENKKVWSGTLYSIYRSVRQLGEIEILGPYNPFLRISILKALNQISLLITSKRISYRHSTFISRGYAAYFNSKLNGKKFDFILAPSASCEIAFLNTDIPIIYIADGTFAGCLGYHKSLTHLRKRSIEQGNLIEKKAIENSKFVIVSSEWAKESVIKDYGCDQAKIHILPFGANLETIPTQLNIEFDIPQVWKLLFAAVYWEDKGGERAFNCMKELLDKGHKVELTVLGCIPPTEFTHPNLKVIPFIDKNALDGQQKMAELFSQHHFLLLPTRFDCTPIVINEASAFGIPSLVARTGGVEGHLKEGINGFTVSYSDEGSEYANKIDHLIHHPEEYLKLRQSTRTLYSEQLNWEKWTEQFKKIISA